MTHHRFPCEQQILRGVNETAQSYVLASKKKNLSVHNKIEREQALTSEERDVWSELISAFFLFEKNLRVKNFTIANYACVFVVCVVRIRCCLIFLCVFYPFVQTCVPRRRMVILIGKSVQLKSSLLRTTTRVRCKNEVIRPLPIRHPLQSSQEEQCLRFGPTNTLERSRQKYKLRWNRCSFGSWLLFTWVWNEVAQCASSVWWPPVRPPPFSTHPLLKRFVFFLLKFACVFLHPHHLALEFWCTDNHIKISTQHQSVYYQVPTQSPTHQNIVHAQPQRVSFVRNVLGVSFF